MIPAIRQVVSDVIAAAELYDGEEHLRISMGVSDAIVDVLRADEAAVLSTTVYGHHRDLAPYAIDSVSVALGRVTIHCQRSSRPPTGEELARLDSDGAHLHLTSYRAASVE